MTWHLGPLEADFLILAAFLIAGLIGAVLGAGSGEDRTERARAADAAAERDATRTMRWSS